MQFPVKSAILPPKVINATNKGRHLQKIIFILLIITSLIACNKKEGNSGSSESGRVGIFYFHLNSFPTTLNPLSSTDYYASQVQSYIIDSLATRNVDTNEWQPALAISWDKDPSGKYFDFTLREGVQWHDGKPLTAEDVKFSFDAIIHPENKYKTAHMRPYYENIGSVEILAPNKVRFNVKQLYFKNFEQCAGLTILPKHIYENPSEEQEKTLNKSLVGSGPYLLKNFKRGKKLELVKNKNWWGNTAPEYKGMYNFDVIRMKAVKEETMTLTMLEKGELDFIGLSAESYIKKAVGPKWEKEVKKVKYQNDAPNGYGFVGLNLENPIFKTKNVRLALYHLLNRDLMIEKFRYGMDLPATGPWYQQSIYADKSVKPVNFDPKQALKLLRSEGWKDTDGDMILDKVINGKKEKLSFTILEPSKDFEKYLTIFKEDAKKAGVEIKIKVIEWNTFIKLLNERKFEAVRLGWSAGSIEIDPKQIWHSSSISGGGSNFIGYNNPIVDKGIDDARMTTNTAKRIKILKKVYREIANDVPYLFFFNSKFGFYGHTKKVKGPKDTFKYGVGLDYWWIEK